MILLIQNIEDYNNDLRVSLQAFYGGERIVVPEIFDKKPELKAEIDKELVAGIDDNRINIELYSVADGGERTLACSTQIPVDGDCRDKSAVRNPLKLAIYNMLSEYTGRRLPWGSLTGIRPTKIAVSYMEAGMTSEDIIGNYQEIYGTSREKAELAVAVADREKKIIDSVAEEDEYCLYIRIRWMRIWTQLRKRWHTLRRHIPENGSYQYMWEAELRHPYLRSIWTDSAA